MKIIIPNMPIPILFDIAQCLESVANISNLDISMWNINTKSTMDAMDESRPDLVFIHQSQLDMSFLTLCQELNCKYVVISTEELPNNLLVQPVAILTFEPFHHLFSANKTINIQPIAKIPQIHNAKYNTDMKSEVLFNTTGIQQIDNVIQEILLYLVNNYNTKIIGDVAIGLHQYLGKVDIFERANFIKSTQIVVDMTGSDYLDAAYLKIPAVSTASSNGMTLQFNSLSTLIEHINSIFNNNSLVKDKYIEQCYEDACKNTSYHFTAKLCNLIGETSLSNTLLQYVKELI